MLVLHLDVAHRSVVHLNNSLPAFVRAHAGELRECRRYSRMPPTKGTPIATLNECLPDVVLQPVRIRQLLDEVLDSILSETKEVRTRDGVGVCTITNVVRGAHDDGPRAGRCSRYDGFLGLVVGDNLEAGASLAVQDLAMVHDFGVRIASREIPSVRSKRQTRMG